MCVPEGKAPFQPCCAIEHPGTENGTSLLSSKGVTIWASSVDDLIRALPFEIDADLEHLHTLEGAPVENSVFEQIDFARDVGVQCEKWGPDGDENMDNYLCVQVDDLANPWGVYGVASGQGPQGHLITALIAHELPGLLVQNAQLHRDSNLALFQSFVRVGEMIGSCQFLDADVSGATLSTILVRAGRLHIAWIGDSKVVVGRLAEDLPKLGGSQVHRGVPLAVRPVEITRDHSLDAEGNGKSSSLSPELKPNGSNLEERSLARVLGHKSLQLPSQPEVRQYRLYQLDVFVIVGSYAFWQQLGPSDAVSIVRDNMHRTAPDTARALIAEAKRRLSKRPGKVSTSSHGITALVVYFHGDKFVSEHSRTVKRTQHLLSGEKGEQMNSHKLAAGVPECACLPEVSRRPRTIPSGAIRY